jgi:hypothetical protein
MAQTDLKSDAWCSYNQSAAPFYWIFEPSQYANTFVYGEVGINSQGGAAGSYVRSDVIDVDSFLSGRDEILSKCNPPAPSMDNMEQPPLIVQNNENTNILLPKYTREKKSAIDSGAIDYARWQPALPSDPQDLRFIIESFSGQRGGLDTSNYAKLSWNPSVARGAAINGDKMSCDTILSPTRYCGEYCSEVNGSNPNIIARPMYSKPVNEPEYPFNGPYSQDIISVGSASCGPNMFYGDNYDQGSCGPQPPMRMLSFDNGALNKY